MGEQKYEGITGKNSKLYSVLFFVIGLIGAIGFRVVLIVNKFNFLLANLVWYVAVVSYIIFYTYRYYIEQKRRQILISSRLKHKLEYDLELDENDKKNMKKIIDSLMISKQNLNLIILIVVSIVSLITQIILDFMLK